MNRPPSPRTTFTVPTYISFANTLYRLWGDEQSGFVPDWIYVSGDKIHQMIFKLASGEGFRHSDAYRTYFAADVVYYILKGSLILINAETGEAQRAAQGETIFFRRDTWHHGLNDSIETLEVLEYVAPPPAQGTTSAYAKQQPNLLDARYAQDQWLTHLPMQRAQVASEHTIQVIGERDVMWRVEGLQERMPVAILVSTENLTVGKIRLLPKGKSPVHAHGGDEGIYVLDGTLDVRVAMDDSRAWCQVKAGDGFYIPQGTAHEYANLSDEPVTFIFGVAPNYLP